MYLNLNSFNGGCVPKFVNVRVSGFTNSIYELEKDTGLILSGSEILKEIVDCLTDRLTATLELEMYCLSLMEKQCHSGIEDELKQIIRLFVETGRLIYRELLEHGLYRNDKLSYTYSNSVLDNLIFIEKSSMLKIINQEINAPMLVGYTMEQW